MKGRLSFPFKILTIDAAHTALTHLQVNRYNQVKTHIYSVLIPSPMQNSIFSCIFHLFPMVFVCGSEYLKSVAQPYLEVV